MADSTSTVGTLASEDYTTMQSWLNAKDGETGTHTAQVSAQQLDGACTLNNGSTAATAFIIEPVGTKHAGKGHHVAGVGACLQHSSQVIFFFDSNGANLTVRDMSIEMDSGATAAITVGPNGGTTVTLERCIIAKRGTATAYAIDARATGKERNIRDCLVYGQSTIGIDGRNCGSGEITGNTVYGGTYGILPSTAASNTVEVHNNISVNNSNNDFFSSDVADSNHGGNIAEDATASTEWDGAGSSHNSVEVLDNQTTPTPTADYVCFEDLGTDTQDFSLVDLEDGTYDPVAIGGGFASKGTGTGVNGQTRHASTPDIGAFETVPASGGAVAVFARDRRTFRNSILTR